MGVFITQEGKGMGSPPPLSPYLDTSVKCSFKINWKCALSSLYNELCKSSFFLNVQSSLLLLFLKSYNFIRCWYSMTVSGFKYRLSLQGVPINMGIERRLESRLWFLIFNAWQLAIKVKTRLCVWRAFKKVVT